MPEVLLIRYGEIALKSPPVRREFEGRLRRNILEAFLAARIPCTISSDHGHLYVHTPEAGSAAPVARRVFGVVSVSPAEVVETDLPRISERVVEMVRPRVTTGARFAVRARRTGNHPFTSQEVGARVGEAILNAFPEAHLHVDLGKPDWEAFVEVRGPKTYVYHERWPGPGGMPLGVAGPVGAHVDGLRGALGAYLLMKRGCSVHCVAEGEGVRLVKEVLCRFSPSLPVESVDDPQEAWEHLKRLAETRGLDGVALPLDVDEFPPAREFWKDVVVFSPTVGMTDEEVSRRWSDVVALAQ